MTPTEWLLSPDTGTSSKTILAVMTGSALGCSDVPHDPDDFGRCYRLLCRFPEYRARMPQVGSMFPAWGPMAAAWEELTALYELEHPSGRCPKLYARMQELHDDGMLASGWTRTGPHSWQGPNAKGFEFTIDAKSVKSRFSQPPQGAHTMTTALTEYKSKLPQDAHDALVAEYYKVTEHLPALLTAAGKIEVADAQDFDSVGNAIDTLAKVKAARCAVERKRVELKAAPLLLGKAIDGMGNHVKAIIAPVEAKLLEQAEFFERAQRDREDAQREARWSELEALDAEPSTLADLGTMHADDYARAVANAKIIQAAKAQAPVVEPAQPEPTPAPAPRTDSDYANVVILCEYCWPTLLELEPHTRFVAPCPGCHNTFKSSQNGGA